MAKNASCFRRFLFATIASAALVILAFVCLTYPRHRINRQAFNEIREGMKRAQVEAIVGVAPGKHTRSNVDVNIALADDDPVTLLAGEDFLDGFPGGRKIWEDGTYRSYWLANTGAIMIEFGADDTVLMPMFFDVVPTTLLGKLERFIAGILSK